MAARRPFLHRWPRRPPTASTLLAGMLVWCALAGVATAGVAVAAPQPADDPPIVRAMVANVGNVSPHCAEQAFSLCLVPVEERVTAGMAAIDPDVVALIEVLPPALCDGVTPQNPFNSCSLPADPPQALRLLAHDDYDVVCGDRYEWDCLAVRSSVGSIDGCDGGYCGRAVTALPAPAGCDDGFQSFVVDVVLHGVPVLVGVTHPNSMDVDCRTAEMADLFAATDDATDVLLLGDFNLDPFREQDASVEVWDDHVGDDRRFHLLSGPTEHDPPYFTLLPFESAQLDATGSLPVNIELGDLAGARTIDHALATSGIGGSCTTLGEAPGTERLEGPGGGLDHRALDCEVVLGVAGTAPTTGAPGPAGDDDATDVSDATGDPPTAGTTETPAGPATLPATGTSSTAGLLTLTGLLAMLVAVRSMGTTARRGRRSGPI